MRKIRLCDTDGALFDEEMIPQDYEYLSKHKETFCRMWKEQGRTFWERFVKVFRSYILRYSLLGDLTCDASQLQTTLDFAFTVITTNFVKGKVNQAKSLLNQIADLGRNRHRFAYLDSKSVIKDPFYTKETRDIFREFFGPANEKSSYIKVYLLTPVYMKFGGSIVRCLTMWVDADEMEDPADDSYYTPPLPIEINTPVCSKHACSSNLCAFHLDDCKTRFYEQYTCARDSPPTPVNLKFWTKGDPRFCEPGNPLYDLTADNMSDWREGLTLEKFQEFYAWCSLNDSLVAPENQCQDCRARRKAKKKNKQKKKKKKAERVPSDSGCCDSCAPTDYGDQVHGAKPNDKDRKTGCGGCPDSTQARTANNVIAGTTTTIEIHTGVSHSQLDALVSYLTSNGHQLFPAMDSDSDDETTILVSRRVGDTSLVDTIKSFKETTAAKASVVKEPVVEAGKEAMQAGAAQRILFTDVAVIRRKMENIVLPVPSGQDLSARFYVVYQTDPITGAHQVAVTLGELFYQKDNMKTVPQTPRPVLGQKDIPFLDPLYLASKGLPPFVYSELPYDGCLMEVNYALQEKSGNPTYFVVRLSNVTTRNLAREIMTKVLYHISLRKKRPSEGWVMNEEDIFAFCSTLGVANHDIKGVTFTISTGSNSMADFLTPEEWNRLTQNNQSVAASTGTIPNTVNKSGTTAHLSSSSISTQPHTTTQSAMAGPEGSQISNGAAEGSKGKKKKKKGKTRSKDPAGETTAGPVGTLDEDTQALEAIKQTEDQASLHELVKALTFNMNKDRMEQSLEDSTPAPGHAGPVNGGGDGSQHGCDGRQFSVCSYCGIREPVLRSFKKCQRCKEQGLVNARYYCGRTCQQKDWKRRHCKEHAEGTLC